MKKTLLLLAAVAAVQLVCAQALRSRGPVPADLKMSVQQLYDTDVQRAEQYAGRRVRDRQQLLEASYRINKMLAGGHIVYGDSISLLAARIADTLLKDYPQLRSELRFYTVTSPVVNAFTTPQGMIFINAGLVAQLENEAQLAFIIAHEIIHYYRAHGMETLVGDKKKADKAAKEALDKRRRLLEMEKKEREQAEKERRDAERRQRWPLYGIHSAHHSGGNDQRKCRSGCSQRLHYGDWEDRSMGRRLLSF